MVDNQTITGGYPTTEQLKAVAAEGYQMVINLATSKSENWMPEEADLVHSLGMAYYHIPVAWENPLLSDFATFERVMGEAGNSKKLIHCQANFRVSAFFSLYAIKHLGWTEAQGEQFRSTVWQVSDYPIWEAFIHEVRKSIQKR
jgi:protein tyrosine phosphatase (PTP) superfamily phosphohydrolase (DUF442 family)